MEKPLLKWVGGKTQILDSLLEIIPMEIENYHEPFVGGGSVLFAILSTRKINGKVYAYDLNKQLIKFYKDVQENPEELYREILKLEEFKTSEEDYYRLRKEYNVTPTSALFLFLNKTCFRGLYRIGPNGFNVPFGNYKNPTLVSKVHLFRISELIQNVEFIHQDFEKTFENIDKEKDFVYIDPPYVPENKKSFTKYTKIDFDETKHEKLFHLTKELKKFILSNSNVDFVKEKFKDYTIQEILCRRAINSKNPESKTLEVLIYPNV
jgi:DNA adenine methylase